MCAKHDERAPEGGKIFTGLLLDEPTARSIGVTSANTVLGPVDARRLGVTLVSESLMYVLPGAQYAYDIKIDRAEVFDILATKLTQFKAAGGGTIVDGTGMFEGRDLRLYEALSRATGVHIVATTGQGPEAMLGGFVCGVR
jgi:phosphotriesterase-related protein